MVRIPQLTALDAVVQGARSVRISDIGMSEMIGNPVDVREPAALERLRVALAVRSLPGGMCMCGGNVGFAFADADGQPLARVGLHHGVSLRWNGWDGDAVLADGPALLRWLDDHGCPEPLREYEEDERRRAQAAEAFAAWRAAVPSALSGVIEPIMDTYRQGSSPTADLLAEAQVQLTAGLPESNARVLALLAWYGSGTARYSGYPSYEALPGQLLKEVPIADLVAALLDPRADQRHDRGAVRHLVGWHSRSKQQRDISRLPADLRARLREQADRSDDGGTRQRAQRLLS